jgi:hypothetical protein
LQDTDGIKPPKIADPMIAAEGELTSGRPELSAIF